MSKKKHSVLGMAALAAAGAGAAVLANKSREEKQITEAHVDPNYRNTAVSYTHLTLPTNSRV